MTERERTILIELGLAARVHILAGDDQSKIKLAYMTGRWEMYCELRDNGLLVEEEIDL